MTTINANNAIYNNMKKDVIKLLSIHGISGEEKRVRNYLLNVLPTIVDNLKVDDSGNILATKTCGNGKGSTIMLSAHMDTVRGVLVDRKLIVNDKYIHSDKGALGADDRSGIAIILSVLKTINKFGFDGTLKIAFSVAEEIGCVGASKINKEFYKDVDLAIVIDRRGNNDIVVGCYNAFCSNEVGNFLENVSSSIKSDWKCVEGGISDAVVFSESGINSINLSCGYMNEHTAKEYLNTEDMFKTYKFIIAILKNVNKNHKKFKGVPMYNDWVKSYKVTDFYNYSDQYFEDSFYKDNFEEEFYNIKLEKLDDVIYIMQDGVEIVVKTSKLESLISDLRSL